MLIRNSLQMSNFDVFLIFVISVVSIEISSQFRAYHHFEEVKDHEASNREFENNARNVQNIPEVSLQDWGHLRGYVNENTRSFTGNYIGRDDMLLHAMEYAYDHFNVSRVLLRTSGGGLYEIVFNDPRVPFQVVSLGPNAPIQNPRERQFEVPYDIRNGYFGFYHPDFIKSFTRARTDRVILRSRNGTEDHYRLIWPGAGSSSSSRETSTPRLGNLQRRVREEGKKDIAQKQAEGMRTSRSKGKEEGKVSGLNYKKMFSLTDKRSSSAGSSSSRSGQERRKGKKNAEEEEEENPEKDSERK